MPHPASDHFQGKSIPDHLKDAKAKGWQASCESHGIEISGSKAALADALRDCSLSIAILWLILPLYLDPQKALYALFTFAIGWALWKGCRSALLGRARLERLHRLIEEERWEIEHHRPQERQELMELYQAKGFEGELLSQVLDVLMADDNRLLRVMLEEELGLTLEAYEHPLKQASWAFMGAILPFLCVWLLPQGVLPVSFVLFLSASLWTARIEKIAQIPSLIWNLSLFFLCTGGVYFLRNLFS